MIDFHAHLGKVMFGWPELTVDKLLRFMDRHGIERSVVLPLVAPEEEDYYYTTEQALADCATHRDRLIPFANMDPRRGSNDGASDFYPVLKEYADLGCRGFGEILANLPTSDLRMKGIYRACGRLGFPVVFDFRLGRVGVMEPAGMPGLEECLQEFPETILVGHGPAWWAEISAEVRADAAAGDAPSLKLRRTGGACRHERETPPGRIGYLLQSYPNMYADLSAGSGYHALRRDRPGRRGRLPARYQQRTGASSCSAPIGSCARRTR